MEKGGQNGGQEPWCESSVQEPTGRQVRWRWWLGIRSQRREIMEGVDVVFFLQLDVEVIRGRRGRSSPAAASIRTPGILIEEWS